MAINRLASGLAVDEWRSYFWQHWEHRLATSVPLYFLDLFVFGGTNLFLVGVVVLVSGLCAA